MIFHARTALSALCLLAVSACSDAENGDSARDQAPDDWSYEGLTGAHLAGEKDPSDAACAEVQHASPIDLPAHMGEQDLPDLKFDYHDSAVSVINDGHTLQWTYEPGSALRIDGASYPLVQFHFHAHSEHAVSGRHAPLELHLVHRDASGHTVVVAVFFEPQFSNDTLEAAGWSQLPKHAGQLVTDARRFNVAGLISGGPSYRYSSSATAPACEQAIDWIIFSRSASISKQQLAAFTALYDDNARPEVPVDETIVQFGE